MIVTVTSTIMDGPVVRWFQSLSAAETHDPFLSASRKGVQTHNDVYLHEIPGEVMHAAEEAYGELRRDRHADVRHLATHVRERLRQPLVPVKEALLDG